MSNPARDITRDAIALSFVWECMALGEECSFSNRSETAVDIWVMPGETSKVIVERAGVKFETIQIRMDVALQYDDAGNQVFPPVLGLSNNSEITLNNVKYRAQTIENRDSLGAIYTLMSINDEGRQAGDF